mgnify:CR=1 FL=1|tara:strand:- start:1380 stop:2276 length:897 start_codon:yes stop_codon:yes gene_type:complete
MVEVSVVTDEPDCLGEAPQWHGGENRLYWVDSFAPAIRWLDPLDSTVTSFPLPADIGSFVFARDGSLVAGMRGGFHRIDLANGTVEPLVNPLGADPRMMLNDGKCDRRGRYWCGSVHSDFIGRPAAIFRLDPDLSVREMDNGFIIGNGIAFSPDDTRMYFADSRDETVWVYDFDIATGSISNRREFFSTLTIEGRVDGAACDTNGNYWCALVHGGEVGCISPEGELIERIAVPCRHPTMVAFGGPDRTDLYVTSATAMLDESERGDWRDAGKVFRITGHGAQGLPEPVFDHDFTGKTG